MADGIPLKEGNRVVIVVQLCFFLSYFRQLLKENLTTLLSSKQPSMHTQRKDSKNAHLGDHSSVRKLKIYSFSSLNHENIKEVKVYRSQFCEENIVCVLKRA